MVCAQRWRLRRVSAHRMEKEKKKNIIEARREETIADSSYSDIIEKVRLQKTVFMLCVPRSIDETTRH